jgi:hypothetical protein
MRGLGSCAQQVEASGSLGRTHSLHLKLLEQMYQKLFGYELNLLSAFLLQAGPKRYETQRRMQLELQLPLFFFLFLYWQGQNYM